MEDSLKRLSNRLGLSGRVSFAVVSRIEDIWASHQVLVMPSRVEGPPLVIVEAMLCGRPVVATDVAGNSEVVEDGVTGFLANAPITKDPSNSAAGLGNMLNFSPSMKNSVYKCRE
jgi:glycosyltransferase involved in cell wall biosynthesis